MMPRIVLTTAVAALLAAAPQALANKVKELNISPYAGFGDAPEIVVYSTSGERWTDVDATATTQVRVRLRAECRWEGRGNKAYKGNMIVPGFARIGSKDPANFLIPHADEASEHYRWDGGSGQSLDPVQACNVELDKRAASEPGKSKYHLLAEGFRIDYPAGLDVAYALQCKPIGLGFTDSKTRNKKINVRIDCQPSALAAEKLPDSTSIPARPIAKKASFAPLLKTGTFEAVPEVHTADCPATIRFDGTLTANRAGVVKYRYTKHDGTQSPEYTLRFDRAGTLKTRAWQTTYSEPDAGKTLSAGNASASSQDFQGWYRLDVLSPEPGGQISAHYRVMCGADAQPEAPTIQVQPARRAVEKQEVIRMEVQQLENAPAIRRAQQPE